MKPAGEGPLPPLQEEMMIATSTPPQTKEKERDLPMETASPPPSQQQKEGNNQAASAGEHVAVDTDAEAALSSGGKDGELDNDAKEVTDGCPSLSVSELIAKGRAPVKREFLRAPGPRIVVTACSEGGVHSEGIDTKASKISAVKKSKRQQKRERLEARKSAENICMAVARANDMNACPYGQSCRFNHDLAAFLIQKPPDIPGQCPFVTINKPCPFGAACRLAGTHEKGPSKVTGTLKTEHSNELNALRKEFQKLLWKNLVSFPKADSQLQAMGLLGKAKKRSTNDQDSGKVQGEVETLQQGLNKPEDQSVIVDQNENLPLVDLHSSNGHLVKQHTLIIEERCRLHCSKKLRADLIEMPSVPGIFNSTTTNDTAIQSGGNVSCNPENMLCGDGIDCMLSRREKKMVDFRGKLYVAPLTTVGNLPFRRVCKLLGADITCGEMAMCTNLLQGQASEWALLRRHSSEDIFGVQICGAHPDTLARTAEMIEQECQINFIDINVGCPIDLVVNKGAGSCLLTKPGRLQQIVKSTSASIDSLLTLKVRTGYFEGRNCVHSFIADVYNWGACALTIHGRTRQQRYSKLADWNYISESSCLAPDCLQVIGNGDIFSYTDWNEHLNASKLSTCMLARGVLIKPWLLTEIKEQRHWDITANERLDILKEYVCYGLEHWGSDSKGVETTRHFLLEWLSYMHRYIPVGLLEVLPQRLNWRPPVYNGRNELESLMASDSAADWVRISEMLLGPAPNNFSFTPRHKSNAYDRAENG